LGSHHWLIHTLSLFIFSLWTFSFRVVNKLLVACSIPVNDSGACHLP
jgi:hypothetical protein